MPWVIGRGGNSTEQTGWELKDYMISAEKKCRKIQSGRIPFSPEVATWIRRFQFYLTLSRARKGRQHNYGNLRRMANRLGISNPLGLLDQEVLPRLQVCCHKDRARHLWQRADKAREDGDEQGVA